MSNWTGRPKVRKHGGMAQSVVRTARNYKPQRGLLAQLVEPTGQVIKLPVHEYLK